MQIETADAYLRYHTTSDDLIKLVVMGEKRWRKPKHMEVVK
jgi:hypothetical protein